MLKLTEAARVVVEGGRGIDATIGIGRVAWTRHECASRRAWSADVGSTRSNGCIF